MAEHHISIPKPFSSGNATEWLQRFEVCSKSNNWNNDMKAVKLPTLLEGEAFAVWQELPEATRNYTEAKKLIITKLAPLQFAAMAEFHKRAL